MAPTLAIKKREHLLMAVVALCLVALGADRLVVSPLARLWQTRAKRITELERSVDKGELLVGREGQIEARWREMLHQGGAEEDAVTEKQVLNAVSQWGTAGGVTVTSLKPRWIEGEEGARKLEVRATASGSLGSVARFLFELEADPQALKVEDLGLTARDDKGQTINCDVRFTRLVLEDGKQR